MSQEFINNTFYKFFIFSLLFGLLLYGTIGFDSIDEVCAAILLVFFIGAFFKSENWQINKSFLITFCIFLFYLGYSFYINSNTKRAIVSDFIVQFKPYLAFFAVYYLKPVFSKNQKVRLRIFCIFAWICLLLLGIASLFNRFIIDNVMFHQAFYGACVTALALIYLYCGQDSKKDKFMFILMLSVGLFSTRSKFYGLYALAIMLILLSPYLKNIKINFKTILLAAIVISVIIIVAWQKIDLYFAISGEDEVDKGLLARITLYMTTPEILRDYFPFGSGFASFASFYSGVYYSDIYVKYGIDKIWAMNSTHYSYIADTYYPCLAQFGIVGMILFAGFFFYLIRKSYLMFKQNLQTRYFIITTLIICYFLIDSVADGTFTGHRGFFMMMLLGLVFSEQRTLTPEKLRDQ
jgi:hypothetical protein